MLKTTHRTWAQARQSAYTDPVGVAQYLVATGQPFPLDLQTDLEAAGYIVDEFRQMYEGGRDTSGLPGFHLTENP